MDLADSGTFIADYKPAKGIFVQATGVIGYLRQEETG